MVTLDERQTKLRLVDPSGTKHASKVTAMIIKLMDPIKDCVKTITFDNGKEFAMHEKIADELNCETYFAHPYHSWERGQN